MSKAYDRVKLTMARHPYISTAIFVLAVNIVSRFVRSGQFSNYQQYSSQPYPTRFFSIESPVVDYPYGNIADVGGLLMEEETLFVMYYAPWCSRSMEMRHEFEKAAKFLENEVLFVAINCWHKLSDCRQRNVFMSFPVFYFYIFGQEGLKYNGIQRADFMVEFILRLLHPITYIASQDKLADFVSERDTCVLSYFDLSSSAPPPAFNEFYSAALLTIERDPKNVVTYGVLTNGYIADQLDLKRSPSVVLVRSLNDSLKFPSSLNFTGQSIAMWALAARQQPAVKWILPMGVKSLTLSSELRLGPALLLFVPANPLALTNHHFALLRQVALTYHNCNHSSIVSGMVTTNVYSIAKGLIRLQLLEKQCLQMAPVDVPRPRTKRTPTKTCCITLRDSSCELCYHYHHLHLWSIRGCRLISTATVSALPLGTGMRGCAEMKRNYNPLEFVSSCCSSPQQPVVESRASRSFPPPSSVMHDEGTDDEDWFVRGRGTQGSLETQCRQLRRLRAFDWGSPSLSEVDIQLLGHHKYPDDFVGLGCRTNQTVKFFAMDAIDSHMFMENLGLDFRLPEKKATLILYNFKNEILHVMKEDYLHHSILGFVMNFTFGSLATFRRTTVKPSNTPCNTNHNEVCVIEVTSKMFRKIVLDQNKDVLLLYYTPWCGFCASFNHVFLTLVHQFRSIENLVFARINGDANDIPWQYTVSEYPTLIFYPAHDKANSVLFPPHEPKTLPNLVKFIFRWSSSSLLLDSSLNVCARDCVTTNMNMSAIRIEALSHEIEMTASEVSKASSYREQLEKELKDFVERGFVLAVAEELPEEITSLLDKIKHLKIHETSLRRKLHRAELQLSSAQHLFRILQSSSSEYYLDQDALLSIVRQHMIYKSRLKTYEAL